MAAARPESSLKLLAPLIFLAVLFAALWLRRPAPQPADAPTADTPTTDTPPTDTPTAEPALHLSGQSMGTTWHVTVGATGSGVASSPDAEAADRQSHQARVQAAVQGALDAVDQRMSTWRADSELSQLGASRSTQPQPVSAQLATVLRIAATVGQASHGAYDVTVAPIVDAWGFGPLAPGSAPPPDRLAQLLQAVGPEQLVLSPDGRSVTKARPEVRADLSSVAKGFGVDQALLAVVAMGYRDVMVEVGGELRTQGHNPQGLPWHVGVERPDGSGAVYQTVDLGDRAMATSGDYRNYRELDGVRISHSIDARTGHPISHKLASVSVLSSSCAWADAWATALNVLGPVDGPALAEDQGLAALFIMHTADGFRTQPTAAWPTAAGPTAAGPTATSMESP